MEYLDFELEVTAADGGGYTVRVLRSPAGEATGTMHLPFSDMALQNRLQALQIALLRSGSTRRRVDTPESHTVELFGHELWDALISGDIRARFEASRGEARRRDAGMRIKLRFEDAGLAALPWEYLFDADRGDYVTLSASTPLVRYIPLPQVMSPLRVQLPLRILGMIASPSDLADLDVDRERQRLDTALSKLVARGLVELVWMDGATTRDLQQMLWRGPWHIFHFVGHGGFDENRGQGLIVMLNEKGTSQRVTATDLGRLLGDHDPLRLAVLNACESARGDTADVFASTAATLVRRGTPAVVAMQYEITDDAAIEFSRSFYDAIADGIAVDAALAEARKGVALAIPGTLEWGTPVLYMRAPDGVLFDIPKGSEPVVPAERAAAAAAAPPASPPRAEEAPRPSSAEPPAPEPPARESRPPEPSAPDVRAAEPLPPPSAPPAAPRVEEPVATAAPPAPTAVPLAAAAAAPTDATIVAPMPPPAMPPGPGNASQPVWGSGATPTPPPTPAAVPGWVAPNAISAGGAAPGRRRIVWVAAIGVAVFLVLAVVGAAMNDPGAFGLGPSRDPGATDNVGAANDPDATDDADATGTGTDESGVLGATFQTTGILFSNDGGASPDIYRVDPSGGEPVRLTTDPEADRWPAWSPNGDRIAYTRVVDGKGDIWVMAADGTRQSQVTSGSANDWGPVWSADGNGLIFTSDRNGSNDIWVVTLDGTDPAFVLGEQVGEPGADDSAPALSPDRDRLAFVSDQDGPGTSIYTLDLSGDNVTVDNIKRLTSGDWLDSWPAWRLDGTLLFARASTANPSDRDLWSVPSGGGLPVEVQPGSTDDGHPVMSSDGLSIAFERTIDGNVHIVVDGDIGRHDLTSGLGGNSTDPSWR